MAEYLLTVRENVGTRYEATVKAVVRATDPGYAKYHWHKQQNQMGGSKDGKHEYAFHSKGYRSKLVSVEELSPEEAEVITPRVPRIPGFNP